MKQKKFIAIILLCFVLMFSVTSCVTYVKNDYAKPRGWFKNKNNPHHTYSTNPGKGDHYKGDHSKGKSKGNSNGKSNGKSKGKHK
ncbi:MAG: hypothetical protein CVU04_04385 [Bacteroidetes bacterium HGW-Bacteroidetes-20]|nr:MAG: hypothetical protein CVU04_04385 [Bacteroidetes bacterium HGW-Bacteroidetes-20]